MSLLNKTKKTIVMAAALVWAMPTLADPRSYYQPTPNAFANTQRLIQQYRNGR
jgi:hypothetical protein